MDKCVSFPTTEKIYVLDNKPAPNVFSCKKQGDNKYLCDGSINNAFWKLQRDNKDCFWYKCSKPFIVKDNGEIDESDYSDCVPTHFQYYIQKEDNNKCNVYVTHIGKIKTNCGNNSTSCCTDGNTCNDTGCLRYKNLDRYIITTDLDYKCDGADCIKTEKGKGDYTTPFCDYKCASILYPKDYACINNYCQKVTNKESLPNQTYYDNPYCDLNCPPTENTSFNCVEGECVAEQGKGGQYSSFPDCYSNCKKTEIKKVEIKKDSNNNKKIIIFSFIFFNIIIIFLIIYIFKVKNK